jgi:peptidoglycan/LPS O-acetylase OafA/YrhL
MNTIAYAMSSRNNNFDVLRLFAALLVLWGHSYPLTADGKDDIFSKCLFGYDIAGGFAVMIFFVISGFLVTKSASERTTKEYLAARALRILPALACVVLFTVIVIGPILTNLSLIDYFLDRWTQSYLTNIFVFGIQYDIPSATGRLLYPGAINGSLWTLSLECGFYVILAVLFHFRLFTPRTAFVFIAAAVLANFYCAYVLGLSWNRPGPNVWKGAPLYQTAVNGSAFLLGSAFWIYRDRISLSAGMVLVCAVALFAAQGTWSAAIVYSLTVPYLVMFFALGTPFKINLRPIGDLSYGVYLVAFPIQQTVIGLLGPQIYATKVSLIATPIVLAIAYFSWWFIEKPCLSLKRGSLHSPGVKRAASVGGEVPVPAGL